MNPQRDTRQQRSLNVSRRATRTHDGGMNTEEDGWGGWLRTVCGAGCGVASDSEFSEWLRYVVCCVRISRTLLLLLLLLTLI